MVWKGPKNDEKTVYLTFDDGPIPEVTPWVLEVLDRFNASATFFCVGENVMQHSKIYNMILDQGHTVGNHTHTHKPGFHSSTEEYIEDVSIADQLIKSPLFRPPYGKMKKSQRKLIAQDYIIVMWDVLSGDFDPKVTPDRCVKNVLTNVTDRSIIVFHDSIKAFPTLSQSLETILQELQNKGFTFSTLENLAFAERIHN